MTINGQPAEVWLTPRRAAFVNEFASSTNMTEAARRAGYSVKTADRVPYKLLQNRDVRSALEDRKQQLSTRSTIDATWYLHKLRMTAEAAIAEGDYPAGARYHELIGRVLGFFDDKTTLKVEQAEKISFQRYIVERDPDAPSEEDEAVRYGAPIPPGWRARKYVPGEGDDD